MTVLGRTTVDLVDTDDSGLIDPAGGPPIYLQLYAILRQRIEDGALAGKLDAAWELAAQFGVSESTAKKALSKLRDDGYVQSRQGWAWWVPGPDERPG